MSAPEDWAEDSVATLLQTKDVEMRRLHDKLRAMRISQDSIRENHQDAIYVRDKAIERLHEKLDGYRDMLRLREQHIDEMLKELVALKAKYAEFLEHSRKSLTSMVAIAEALAKD